MYLFTVTIFSSVQFKTAPGGEPINHDTLSKSTTPHVRTRWPTAPDVTLTSYERNDSSRSRVQVSFVMLQNWVFIRMEDTGHYQTH